MLRRANFYGACIACGLCLLLLLAGSRYTDNVNYRSTAESRRNIRNFLKTTSEESSDNLVQIPIYSDDEGSSNTERIFEKTRGKIKRELSNFNFSSIAGIHHLSDLIIEKGGSPLRSVIVSTWRSGTTFLGEVLNAIPGNFYHYEPLLNYEIIQIRGPPYAETAMKHVTKLLKCDFDGMEKYFEYGKTHLHQFNHNTRLWDHCKYFKELCFDPVFTSKFCKLFPFQSMKVVRLRLRLVEELLLDKEIRLKIVLLVRDPRGVMQSRQHRDFCQPAPDCWQPALVCADMVSDYVAAVRMMEQFPDRFMVLRYEDLALNPNGTTHQMLKFLELAPTASVDEFLYTHTNTEVAGVSSTFRVSREVPFRWKNVLDFKTVDDIQQDCKEALSHWGYKLAHNATHLASDQFYPLGQYTLQ